MQKSNYPKLGSVCLISENDSVCQFGKEYILAYLYHRLKETWDVDFMLISNEGKTLSTTLKECNPVSFPYSYEYIVAWDNMPLLSSLIKTTADFKTEIAKANNLYWHLYDQYDKYDAFIFVGLTPAIVSLLPLTRKRNCIIPLLKPRYEHIIQSNQAMRFAMMNCDYFYCHSRAEAKYIQLMQPHAEIRVYPLMIDLEFSKKSLMLTNKVLQEKEYVLCVAEDYNETLRYFEQLIMRLGYEVIILCGQEQEEACNETGKYVSFHHLVTHFDTFIEKIKAAFFFMQEDFFPLLYNLAQHRIPLYLSRNYPWQELLDGNGVNLLSFEEDLTIAPDGVSILPHEYHHFSYYTSYMIKFMNEWCMDNKLRFRKERD